jgi:hypothetical protein
VHRIDHCGLHGREPGLRTGVVAQVQPRRCSPFLLRVPQQPGRAPFSSPASTWKRVQATWHSASSPGRDERFPIRRS